MVNTLNKVVNILREIQDGHAQLNGFKFGQIPEWDDEKLNATNYPFLFVAPPEITEARGVRTFEFPIAVGQPIRDDKSDEQDTWNSLAEVIFDVVNHFRHNYSSASDADIARVDADYAVTISPFTERLDNILTGWETVLVIRVDSENNLCLAP